MRQSLKVCVWVAMLVTLAGNDGWAAPGDWSDYREPAFGARIAFPHGLFQPVPRAEGDVDQQFLSLDGDARMAIAAWRNVSGDTPAKLKSKLLRQAPDSDVTYQPRGRSWVVFSGYQGDKIFYHKVMYSCRGEVITAFGITYPVARRALYDPVVERMEDSFRPGPRCP